MITRGFFPSNDQVIRDFMVGMTDKQKHEVLSELFNHGGRIGVHSYRTLTSELGG